MTITEFFSKSGPLAKQFKDYETREGQIMLSRHIAKVFRDGDVGLFEAGTGIGKSLAYLYPAFLKSKEKNLPVVVSTTTNNLLSQLLYKDLPLLEASLHEIGEEIKYIGLKGKSHYACIAKIESNEDESLQDIITDIEKTKNGERSELGYQIYDQDWRKINYDRETCAGAKCPFYKDCFIVNLKRKAEKANIIVTNHNIIFAEKLAKFQILPDYEDLILDEGHNIEDTATDYLTDTLSLRRITALIKDIYYEDGKGKLGIAFFPKLKNYLDIFMTISNRLFLFQKDIEEYLVQQSMGSDDNGEFIINNKAELIDNVKELDLICDEIIRVLDGVELPQEKQMFFVTSVYTSAQEIKIWIKNLTDPNLLLWCKIRDKEDVYIYETPLNIGLMLKENLFDALQSVNIISATLTVNKSFDYIKSRLGLNIPPLVKEGLGVIPSGVSNPPLSPFDKGEGTRKIISKIFPSPFDYAKQMQVNLIDTVPDQKDFSYTNVLAEEVLNAIEKTKGNAFVLFTSMSIMNNIAEQVREELENKDIKLLVQESGNREEIVKTFKEGGAVLFGLESFWEGVDIPGKALSHVIIIKLPFKVPSSPIEKARAEVVENAGGNSFYNLSLPQAVIKFRQGIGRLIRTKNDSGHVTILDSRITKSSYGKVFLREMEM